LKINGNIKNQIVANMNVVHNILNNEERSLVPHQELAIAA